MAVWQLAQTLIRFAGSRLAPPSSIVSSTEQAAIISGGRFALEDRETAVRQLRADVDLLAQLDHVEALLGGYGHRELVALAEMDALYASESDAAVTQETPDAL